MHPWHAHWYRYQWYVHVYELSEPTKFINSSMVTICNHSTLIDINIHGMSIFFLSPSIMFYSDHGTNTSKYINHESICRRTIIMQLYCKYNFQSFSFPHFLESLNSEIHMAEYSKNGIALITEITLSNCPPHWDTTTMQLRCSKFGEIQYFVVILWKSILASFTSPNVTTCTHHTY